MNMQLHRTGALVIHGARCLVSVVSPDGRADGGAVYEVPYSTPEDQEAERETGMSYIALRACFRQRNDTVLLATCSWQPVATVAAL